MLGLGFDHDARAREAALVEPGQQPIGEAFGRERGDVDAGRGRIELHLLDQIGRRGHQHGRAGVETARELVERAALHAEAGEHRVGWERGDVAEGPQPEPHEQVRELGDPRRRTTGHGARNAADAPDAITSASSGARAGREPGGEVAVGDADAHVGAGAERLPITVRSCPASMASPPK